MLPIMQQVLLWWVVFKVSINAVGTSWTGGVALLRLPLNRSCWHGGWATHETAAVWEPCLVLVVILTISS